MEESIKSGPALIGRDSELAALKQHLADAISGRGSTVLISGEPGIGKTRLVDELKSRATTQNVKMFCGGAASDTIHPFLVFSNAIEREIDRPLFHERESVSFEEIFAVNRSGLLVSKASSGEKGLDADIFADMVSAVQDFVRDSFDSSDMKKAGLGKLEYGDMKILIEHGGEIFVAAVISAAEHGDMRKQLKRVVREIDEKFGPMLGESGGEMSCVAPIQELISGLAECKFLVRRELEGLSLQNERVRIASHVLAFLAAEAEQEPVLLLLEDMHWADESSLFVLSYLARNLAGHRIMVLATLRPGESQALSAAMDAMRSEGTARELRLEKLSDESVANVVAHLFSPNDFRPNLAGRLAIQCGGNPFFVTEILRQMLADGCIERRNGTYTLVREEYAMPDTVEEMVHRRLDTFESDAVLIAEYASCIGREFQVRVAMSAPSVRDSGFALRKVQEGNVIIRHNGSAEFTHAIFQDVIYQDIGERWKSTYHRSIGEYYESAYSGKKDYVLYELARHFSRSSEHQKSYDYCIRAAEKAESAFAAEQAIMYYDLALAEIPYLKLGTRTAAEKIRLMLKKAEMLKFAGKWDEAVGLYRKCVESALRTDLEDLVAKAKFLLASILRDKGDYDEAIGLFRESLSLYEKLEEKSGSAQARQGMGTVHYFRGDFEDAMKDYQSALAMMGDIGDEALMATTLGEMGNVHFRRGEYAKAMGYYSRKLALAEKLGDRRAMGKVYGNMGNVYHEQIEFEMAMEFYLKQHAIALEMGDKHSLSIALGNLGSNYKEQVKLDKARECLQKKMELAKEMGDKYSIATAWGNIGLVFELEEDHASALECYDKVKRLAEQLGDKRLMCAVLGNSALVLRDLRQFEEAGEKFDRCLAIARELDLKYYLCTFLDSKGVLAYETDNLEEAKALNKEAACIAEEIGNQNLVMRSKKLAALILSKTDLEAGIKAIEQLLEAMAEEDPFNTADISWELYKISKSEKHRHLAIECNRSVYKDKPLLKYMKRAEELDQ